MADGDDEVVADEDHDLAESHDLVGVDVLRGLEHDEERVTVKLELGALVGVDRVLDRERVQRELLPDRVELLLGRFVEADPGEDVRFAAGVHGVWRRRRALTPPAVLVDRAVDDHRRCV